ncbi:hypothetical protein HY967_04665 [Candidatus Jorgensenbacteria bacterium]|nr:hypothetical protein [Candidatus Jorgensenbacteria bacterium]
MVTNREGKRLATAFHGRGRRFVNNKPVPTGFARFRTTKSDLVLVEVGKYSGDGKVRAYRLVTEGLRCFLVEQNLGVFHVAGSTVYHNEDIYNFKWTSDSFSGEKQKEIQAAFAPVVQAVVTKTDHNCFQNCCEPHYAMTVEEEREFRKQMADNRRAKQKNPKTNVTPTSTKPEEPTEIVPTEIVPPPVSEPSTAEVSDNDNGKGKGKKPKGATKRSKKGDNGTAKKTDGNVVTTPVDEPTSVAAG